jgi:hypothetical protein
LAHACWATVLLLFLTHCMASTVSLPEEQSPMAPVLLLSKSHADSVHAAHTMSLALEQDSLMYSPAPMKKCQLCSIRLQLLTYHLPALHDVEHAVQILGPSGSVQGADS